VTGHFVRTVLLVLVLTGCTERERRTPIGQTHADSGRSTAGFLTDSLARAFGAVASDSIFGRRRVPFTMEVEDAINAINGQPIAFRALLRDVAGVGPDSAVIRLIGRNGHGFDLRTTRDVAKEIIATRSGGQYAVVARITLVTRAGLEISAQAPDDPETEAASVLVDGYSPPLRLHGDLLAIASPDRSNTRSEVAEEIISRMELEYDLDSPRSQ
jgi:hypothetical protein